MREWRLCPQHELVAAHGGCQSCGSHRSLIRVVPWEELEAEQLKTGLTRIELRKEHDEKRALYMVLDRIVRRRSLEHDLDAAKRLLQELAAGTAPLEEKT